jgi:multidrug efflux pump subunit AcrA (membrane-fusion protein)
MANSTLTRDAGCHNWTGNGIRLAAARGVESGSAKVLKGNAMSRFVPRVVVNVLIGLGCCAAANAAEPVVLESVLVTFVDDIEVPARQTAVLEKLLVREGDRVTAGQMLAQLDAAKLELACDRARHELQRARLEAANDAEVRYALKAAEVAKAELQRANESVQKFRDSVSKSEVERLRLELARAEAGIEKAEHERKIAEAGARIKETEVKEAEVELARTRIAAPFDGLVLEVQRDVGEWVAPGETVVRLVRIDRLRAEGFLGLRELRRVRVGAEALLSVNSDGGQRSEHRGRLSFVSPQADPVTGQFRVRAEFENAESLLRPGLEARMSIQSMD